MLCENCINKFREKLQRRKEVKMIAWVWKNGRILMLCKSLRNKFFTIHLPKRQKQRKKRRLMKIARAAVILAIKKAWLWKNGRILMLCKNLRNKFFTIHLPKRQKYRKKLKKRRRRKKVKIVRTTVKQAIIIKRE